MIILCRPRFAEISSIRGNTAARPRSMKLCPPTFTTLASGRIWTSGCSDVRASSASSVRLPETSDWPSAVRSSFCIRCGRWGDVDVVMWSAPAGLRGRWLM
jgi:hypothetical protein